LLRLCGRWRCFWGTGYRWNPGHNRIIYCARRAHLFVVLMVVGVLIAGITGALAIMFHTPAKGVELSDLLNKNPDAYVLSLGHILDLTGKAMSLFEGHLLARAWRFFSARY